MITDDKADEIRVQLVADYEDYLYKELTNEEVLAIAEHGVFTRQEITGG